MDNEYIRGTINRVFDDGGTVISHQMLQSLAKDANNEKELHLLLNKWSEYGLLTIEATRGLRSGYETYATIVKRIPPSSAQQAPSTPWRERRSLSLCT
jgi:hypothetical protein